MIEIKFKMTQALLSRNAQPKSYLEIGIADGLFFRSIQAEHKFGVDPIAPHEKTKALHLKNELMYFEMTSDDFFKNHDQHLKDHPPDVIFVDGLHVYEQALRDIENSLIYLNEGGIITIDDCNPLSAEMGDPIRTVPTWTGDVWKAILHLRSTRSDIEVFVLNFGTGLGVLRKKETKPAFSFTPEEIKKMTYEDLDKNRDAYLNLKHPDYFLEFFDLILKEERELEKA